MPRIALVCFLLALAALSGCGGGSTAVTENAPAETIEVDIEGTWQGQMVVNEQEAAQKLGEHQLEALRKLRMEMTFRPDGTLQLVGEMTGKSEEGENKWDLVGTDGNTLTIKVADAKGREKNMELFFLDSHSFETPLSTEVANLGAMRFTRVR